MTHFAVKDELLDAQTLPPPGWHPTAERTSGTASQLPPL